MNQVGGASTLALSVELIKHRVPHFPRSLSPFGPVCFPSTEPALPLDAVCRLLFVEGVPCQDRFLYSLPFPHHLRGERVSARRDPRSVRHLTASVCPATVQPKHGGLERASMSPLGVVCCCMWEMCPPVKCLANKKKAQS